MIAYANKFAELRPLFVKVYQNKRRSNMASLLERLKYIIEDIFGKKTYAESQRDKYKKVVRNLEKELKKKYNGDESGFCSGKTQRHFCNKGK